jgi:hypothetical protein
MFKKISVFKRKASQKTERSLKKNKVSDFPTPEVRPLSPCYVERFTTIDGKQEDNKGYLPVALLMRAIDDDRMLNIAVAGNYGVGKSSVIKTAERDLKTSHKFIHISLAALLSSENKAIKDNENKGNDSGGLSGVVGDNGKAEQSQTAKGDDDQPAKKNTISKVVKDKQIEYSILQQILYHDRPQVTPKSRIKRIHKTRCWKPFLIALFIILFVSALLVCLSPKWVSLYVLGGSINAVQAHGLIRWALAALSVMVLLACFYVGKNFNLTISRVGYKDVEMKIKDKMSIFNAYLDEIVYFFESTEYDVVVFEDLDRFENREVIFYKLRELNTILNHSNCLNRKIRFVYAVLDDLFGAEERVKFFDYIVTVIPVINSLNSYEIVKDLIRPEELFDKLGENEFTILCDYLQDMRLVLNIINEFNQFAPLLDPKVMSEKVLFGLIVYKNYLPSDFALMYNRTGVVAAAIEHADHYKVKILEGKKKEIERNQAEISAAEDNYLKSIAELRKLYLQKGLSLSGYPTDRLVYKIKGNLHDHDTIAKKSDLFDCFRRGEASLMYNGNSEVPVPTFQTIERNVIRAGSYDDSLARYKAEYENMVHDREARIHNLRAEISSLSTSIHSIYSADAAAMDKELARIENDEKRNLVKFLILNGYLDKYYQYYISYFYPNSLNLEERNFVMLAGRFEKTSFDAELRNVGEVIKRFSIDSFASNTSLLNVSLVRVLFGETRYKDYRNPVCRNIKNSRNLDFILACYRSSLKVPDGFFYQLLGIYDYWADIASRSVEDQDDLRVIYLKYCSLEEGRVNDAMKSWLKENYSFINRRMTAISSKRVLEGLLPKCAPVFAKLSLNNTPDDVLKDILDNRRYSFTRSNVSAIVRRLGFYDKYSSAAYTSLLEEKKAESLRRRVESRWADAFKNVFPESSFREEPNAILAMLNIPKIPLNNAQAYLSRQSRRIKSAELINKDALDLAFKCSLVEASWRNVYYYSEVVGRGLPLSFLNDNQFQEKVRDTLLEKEELALRQRLVFSNQLELSRYAQLVPWFDVPFKEIGHLIRPERMKVLVENDYLVFNETNFKTIKEHYAFSSIFLSRNVRSFLKNPTGYRVDSTDIMAAIETLDTKVARCEFIRAIRENIFTATDELADLVRPLYSNGDLKASEINRELLLCIIAKSSSVDRKKLGRRAILLLPYSREYTTMLLKAMGAEYKRLTSDTAKSTLSSDRDTVLIVDYLFKNGYIRGVEKKGGKIIVTK